MDEYKLLVRGASQVVQVCGDGARSVRGEGLRHLALLQGSSGYSVLVALDGRIADIGEDDVIQARYKHAKFNKVIEASGKCVMPGLVDAHTHPVWAGDRVEEFALKLAGASYMDVHKAGGGIHYTVECTRHASEDNLYRSFRQRLDTMIRLGTTLVECKSGYGLDMDTEIKMLRVMERGRASGSIDISSTFCGAHAVPKGLHAGVYADEVVSTQLPAVEQLMRTGELHVDNIDVFCETGVFNLSQSRQILSAGMRAGLQANFHGEELSCLHSAEVRMTASNSAKVPTCLLMPHPPSTNMRQSTNASIAAVADFLATNIPHFEIVVPTISLYDSTVKKITVGHMPSNDRMTNFHASGRDHAEATETISRIDKRPICDPCDGLHSGMRLRYDIASLV